MGRRRAAQQQFLGMDGRKVLEFTARYARPYDDTTIMNVFHRTTDGGVSVLLEREDIGRVADWFRNPVSVLRLDDLQTEASLTPDGELAGVSIRWKGSGRTSSVILSDEGRSEVSSWLAHIDAHGWEGWKSGLGDDPS